MIVQFLILIAKGKTDNSISYTASQAVTGLRIGHGQGPRGFGGPRKSFLCRLSIN